MKSGAKLPPDSGKGGKLPPEGQKWGARYTHTVENGANKGGANYPQRDQHSRRRAKLPPEEPHSGKGRG